MLLVWHILSLSFIIENWPCNQDQKLFALKFVDDCSVLCILLDYTERQWAGFKVDKQLINFDNELL